MLQLVQINRFLDQTFEFSDIAVETLFHVRK